MKTDMIPVLVIGAGPAGLGCAIALQTCGITTRVLDAVGVGSSFTRWPKQMRLLTPSFHSNAFGAVDLNALTPQTSVADFLHTQHPTGPEYARYLQALAGHHGLRVDAPVRVTKLSTKEDGTFEVMTDQRVYHAKNVIWAAGEFGHPDDGGIVGAELCIHNSRVGDWEHVAALGDKFAIVGGYESGVDAAIQLMKLDKEVHLLSRGCPWGSDDPDPSRSLSPSTRDRLRATLSEARIPARFYQNANIVRVKRVRSGYEITDDQGTPFATPTPPILATGFRHALEPMRDMWEWKDGLPVFTEAADESTRHRGLFYSGPSLSHRGMLFCFIYKFRSRFGVIARTIAERLGHAWNAPLQPWKEAGFMLDDLSCCADCQCAVESEVADAPSVVAYVA